MAPDWLRHAFAIESADEVELTESQRATIDLLCRHVVARELTTPALLFLETVRPLNYVTAQTLQFFAPFLSSAGNSHVAAELTEFLERRGSIDVLCRRIEELERERTSKPR